MSSSAFLTLPTSLRPTLLLEQTRLDRRMRGLIRAATGGGYVPNRGEFLDLRCARAIACEQDDVDVDLRESCMTVSLFPPMGEVPVFDIVDGGKARHRIPVAPIALPLHQLR